MKIITNADDLGLSPGVDHAIFELMSEGLVTSATMLANGRSVSAAALRLKEFPLCSFGAHLNLTEFAPLGGGAGLARLLDSQGRFCGNVRAAGSLWALREAVYQEWCAQVEYLLHLGVPVSHLDGHHHVHTIPALFPALKAVQRRYGIRRVRLSLNVYSAAEASGRKLPLLQKSCYNFCLRSVYRTRTTDAFMSLSAYYEHRARLIARYRCGEIMLHPGAESSVEETKMLRELGQSGVDFKSNLVSYLDL